MRLGEFAYGGLRAIGKSIINREKESFGLLAKGDITGFLYKQTGADLIQSGANALAKAGNAYIEAWKKDPWDTLAKTLIAAGGIALAIPSGGSSLVAAGAVLGGAGAVIMTAQESYGYANAKTEEGLKQDAVTDVDDLLWIGGGLLTTAQGVRYLSSASKLANNGQWADELYGKSIKPEENLRAHFEKHVEVAARRTDKLYKSELGVNTIEDYDRITRETIIKGFRHKYIYTPKNTGIPEIRTGFYNPKTGVWTSLNPKGQIATSFIPKEGWIYSRPSFSYWPASKISGFISTSLVSYEEIKHNPLIGYYKFNSSLTKHPDDS